MRADRQAGSGSVLVIALVLIALVGLQTGAWLAAVLHAQQRLRAAADLVALAAAERSYLLVATGGACPQSVRAQADRVATANDARVTGCVLESQGSVLVTVAPTGRQPRGSPVQARARAAMPVSG